MLTKLIWICGISVETLLLYRGIVGKLVSRYPNFYVYILSIFIPDVLFFVAPLAKIRIADKLNWDADYVTLLLGAGIVLEIFRHVLAPYPGAEKVARFTSYAFLASVMVFMVVYPMFASNSASARTLFYRLQRDFLSVQGLLLIVIIQVMAYYAIPAGRNLKGMILGYGLMMMMSLCGLALRAVRGVGFDGTYNYIQTLAYLSALVIWLIALWSYRPDQGPTPRISGDEDYDRLASRTRGMVDAAGSHLVKVERL